MTETKLPPDTGTICALLGIEAGPLADIFRHEAARLMRQAADRVEDGVDTSRDPIVADVRMLLALVEALEDEWELRHEEEGDRAAFVGGTEATPRTPGETPPQSRDDMVSAGMRALGGERQS